MTLFRRLINSSLSADLLNTFLSENIQSFYALHNSNIERLNKEKNDIRDFIEGKRLIFEQLDFTSNINKAFISVLFDFSERFGFAAFATIENIQRRHNLYLGQRREAAKLFLLNIRETDQYINRYEQICTLLQSALETEEDTDKDVVVTFLNYYAKVVLDTSNEYSRTLKTNVIASRESATFSFLQSDYVSSLLEIDISDSTSAYSSIHNLIDEIYERDYAIDEVEIDKGYIVEEGTDYGNSLDSQTFSFNRIRQIAVERYNESVFLYHRGVLPLKKPAEMYTYINKLGPMHKAKLDCCFDFFPFTNITNAVEIIDWGCGQALATVVLNDYLNEKNINHLNVDKIILIEPSELTLKRAALHTKLTGITDNIKTVCKGFNHLNIDDVKTDPDSTKIHLFSNVIDIDENIFSQDRLIELIQNSQSGMNYFICSSPFITDYKTNQIDNFVRSFTNREMIYTIDNRRGNWINEWSRVLRVFKIDIT